MIRRSEVLQTMSSHKTKLTDAEVQNFLQTHPEWMLENGKLSRAWIFPGFLEAMDFVNRIAGMSERANHHPDIDIRYNRVTLSLISHDSGGITARDTRFAGQLSEFSSINP
jgi:4a-hydroxytetrahydrobiopterin dehydratase